MTTELPPKPDFEAIEAAAPETAERRNLILAMIGNMVFSWSNNESLFIYVLMALLDTDQASAAIIFATLNTTRARLDLIQRLARVHVSDRSIAMQLNKLIDRFNECTRIRNEFNHCMYMVDTHGAITHTHSIKIVEKRRSLSFGEVRPMDEPRLQEMMKTINELRRLNRDIWAFLPCLENHLREAKKKTPSCRTKKNSTPKG